MQICMHLPGYNELMVCYFRVCWVCGLYLGEVREWSVPTLRPWRFLTTPRASTPACPQHYSVWMWMRKTFSLKKVSAMMEQLHFHLCFNSLAPGKFEWNSRCVIFKQISVIDGWGISCEIALIWMSLDFIDDQSTLVQVMAWCCQATSHYLGLCWPRSLSPYGVTRPQWVNVTWFCWLCCRSPVDPWKSRQTEVIFSLPGSVSSIIHSPGVTGRSGYLWKLICPLYAEFVKGNVNIYWFSLCNAVYNLYGLRIAHQGETTHLGS